MKVKAILKFYFTAESLDRAFDNLIIKHACAYAAEGTDSAEKLCSLIEERAILGNFWSYLDGVISGLPECDRITLDRYSTMRCGFKALNADARREIKRAVIKFVRRTRGIERFFEAIALTGKYYCLMWQG